jgi:cytochrome c
VDQKEAVDVAAYVEQTPVVPKDRRGSRSWAKGEEKILEKTLTGREGVGESWEIQVSLVHDHQKHHFSIETIIGMLQLHNHNFYIIRTHR